MAHFYTNEENTLIFVSLLKEHGIKRIIVSPGTTNISFVGSVQSDPFFEVYSAVDERAAAFMACGLAEESGEPVVLSCTGATASRNYIPGMTEAFYRHLPVLAVTSTQHTGRVGNYVAQVIDRSSCFIDMVKDSIYLPGIYTEEDKQHAITNVNRILLELTHRVCGPCHINLYTSYSNDFSIKELPKYRTIHRITRDDSFPELPNGRIGVFVGAHQEFSDEETKAIDFFCQSHDAIVICDQISNYRGRYRFLANLTNSQHKDQGVKEFDLIIYIGYVHGSYISFKGRELWRVNPDGIIRDPYRNITHVFEMEEKDFFLHYVNGEVHNALLKKCRDIDTNLRNKMPELSFSNLWIAKETVGVLPDYSILHLAILNTLRSWNYFETPQNVLCFSNSGGYGIDGCLSSFLGSAIANQDREHFLIIGDLSFFYDINSLFNKLTTNVHIMLINNGVGAEFKNYNHRASYFGEEANDFIAAKGHNGFKNSLLVKKMCEELSVKYISASTKEEYLKNMDVWMKVGDGPSIFEIFTNDYDESDALRIINEIGDDSNYISRLRKTTIWKFMRRLIRR